jgi:chromosome segregation ATPase
MLLLNIFQHGDTTFAWDNLLILIIAAVAGYLFCRYTSKKADQKKWLHAVEASELKYKRAENEFKNFKSNMASAEKHSEKAVVELSNRVKALEGDIRVLSDEKNKFGHGIEEKNQEIKRMSRLIGDVEDRVKLLQEAKIKSETDWEAKLKASRETLAKAMVWEQKVRAAEEDTKRARAAINFAERKKLEAELRLKAATEYAGKVIPMETELKILKEKYVHLEHELESSKNGVLDKDVTQAQLELFKQNNLSLQKELETKHAVHISLIAEMELLKTDIKKLFDERELQKPSTQPAFKAVSEPVESE